MVNGAITATKTRMTMQTTAQSSSMFMPELVLLLDTSRGIRRSWHQLMPRPRTTIILEPMEVPTPLSSGWQQSARRQKLTPNIIRAITTVVIMSRMSIVSEGSAGDYQDINSDYTNIFAHRITGQLIKVFKRPSNPPKIKSYSFLKQQNNNSTIVRKNQYQKNSFKMEKNEEPQSTNAETHAPLPVKTKKRCYYQVLEAARDATPAELKTQYKKLALKYHPDKSKQEDAKERFVQIQQAWKILSDVNERTWYDNNRESILFNKHQMTKEEFELQSMGFDIKPYFKDSCFKDFEDGPEGFYTVYRKVFELIKEEERKAFEFNKSHNFDETEDKSQKVYRKYMGFGDSRTGPEDNIKFYSEWETFQTFKTFAWADEYNLKDAENREIRRQMQKQNNKERQKQRKLYVARIKELVALVKKKDPRRQLVAQFIKQEEARKEEQRKRKMEEDKIRRQQQEEQRQKQLEQTRQRLEALKTQEQKEKERQQWIEKPKIQERRQKLVKHQCVQCLEIFKDFNEHFRHLQKSGHAKSK